jgi:hypothetical protein
MLETRSVNTARPPVFLKRLVPALLAILAGAVVQQLQTEWGWAAILLVGAILLPLAIWWGLREPRAPGPLIRYGFLALAIAYVLLTAAFSILGDQLAWLWRISISAPIGAAAIAVLLLSRENHNSIIAITCVAIIGFGIAAIGPGVVGIVDNKLAVGVAWIGIGVAAIGLGVAGIVDDNLIIGVAGIGAGVAAIGAGVVGIVENHLVIGVAAIGAGVAVIGLGVAIIVANHLVIGVAAIGAGVAMIGGGSVVALGHLRDQSRSRILSAERNDQARDTRSKSLANSHDVG